MKRRVAIVRPTSDVWSGNETTARRWAAMIGALGFAVELHGPGDVPDADVLVALHAVKSASTVAAFRARYPDRPIIVALTGTDLYPRLSRAALRTLSEADGVIVLQPLALRSLPKALRRRARVILQSVPLGAAAAPRSRTFDVGVAAHLRSVKDPLRAAAAVRDLPASSRLRVLHVGAPLDARLAARASAEAARNERYVWLGVHPPPKMRSFLRRCQLIAVTSVQEGGPNIISEALATGVPVIATKIEGNVGLLGANYPGLIPPRNARALRQMLLRAESDPAFLARLRRASARLAPRFSPERERAEWARLFLHLGLQ